MALTERRRANLEKLAAYLEALPVDYKHFEMGGFAEHAGDHDFDGKDFEQALFADPVKVTVDCGTVACAVGHGPAAGIPFAKAHLTRSSIWSSTRYDIQWGRYSENFATQSSDEWEWMFGGGWSDSDNHHHGAAARIRYYLDRGVPSDFDDSSDADHDTVMGYALYRVSHALQGA